MGNFASTLFSSLLGWLQGAAAWVWDFFQQPDQGGFILWVAENWLPLFVILCAACMVIDAVVYFFRWQPHKVWASFFRRISGKDSEDDGARIRRKWIHADGSTSVDEVPVDEVPPEQVMPNPYAPQPETDLAARYAMYQRPQEEVPAEQAPVYQQPVYEPPVQPAYEAPVEPAAPVDPRPVVQDAPVQEPQRPLRRRRFYEPVNDLPLRYAPPPATDNATDFHEPYVPQQWRRPADTGASNSDLGGSGL